jgi:hypothetical protein
VREIRILRSRRQGLERESRFCGHDLDAREKSPTSWIISIASIGETDPSDSSGSFGLFGSAMARRRSIERKCPGLLVRIL